MNFIWYIINSKIPKPTPNEGKTICILLVIVDSLPTESIWEEFATNQCGDYACKIVIHAKNRDAIASQWIKDRLIPENLSFKPEWNSPEVIRAILACLGEGLKDLSCTRFVFATGTSYLYIYFAYFSLTSTVKNHVFLFIH